ncbi:uncharacterized protein METZ01_LOCUS427369, partial [marine metagenome]
AYASTILSNSTLVVALFNQTALQLGYYDTNGLINTEIVNFSNIPVNEIKNSTSLRIIQDNEKLRIAWQKSDATCGIISGSGETWNEELLFEPELIGSITGVGLEIIGDSQPALACAWTNGGALFDFSETQVWERVAELPPIAGDLQLLKFAENTHLLHSSSEFNSLALSSLISSEWTTAPLGGFQSEGLSARFDQHGVIRIAAHDINNLDLNLLRLLTDSDHDFIPDFEDELPNISGQWGDHDGDGFGDNPDGNGGDQRGPGKRHR